MKPKSLWGNLLFFLVYKLICLPEPINPVNFCLWKSISLKIELELEVGGELLSVQHFTNFVYLINWEFFQALWQKRDNFFSLLFWCLAIDWNKIDNNLVFGELPSNIFSIYLNNVLEKTMKSLSETFLC
jgi:hypothetical protein